MTSYTGASDNFRFVESDLAQFVAQARFLAAPGMRNAWRQVSNEFLFAATPPDARLVSDLPKSLRLISLGL